jgi:hypothetical protein
MTGQYSIRNGLSLIAIEGSPYELPARAFTMGKLFKGSGYATAIFGKWRLGGAPQSLPTAHGFDEFYGIPPGISWDAATYVDTMELTKSVPAPPGVLWRPVGPGRTRRHFLGAGSTDTALATLMDREKRSGCPPSGKARLRDTTDRDAGQAAQGRRAANL